MAKRTPGNLLVCLAAAAVYCYLAGLESIKNNFPVLCPGLVPGFSVNEIPDLTGKVSARERVVARLLLKY